VVTAAARAIGSIVVQLAVAAGARVTGIAGGPGKCASVCELGAEACVDYKAQDVNAAVSALCPDRVDVIFDNVAGRSWTRKVRGS
jgi:hypothetical protein